MRRSSNKGTVSLLVAGFVLPLLFLAFSLGLDLTAYQSARTAAQSILDNAALHAARFLPFRDQAAFAAVEFASRAGLDPQFLHASAPVDSDRIIISYDKGMPMAFPALLGVDVTLPVAAMSAARVTPKDTMLVLDLSSTLAPGLSGASWGNSNEWDAQIFGGQDFAGVTSVIATQQCFNPVLNSYKKAAIDLYDYLSSFRFNQVGITVSPSVTSGIVDQLRPVTVGGFQNGAEAQFIDGGTPIRNAVCLAISEREPQSSSNYANFSLYAVDANIGSQSAPPAGRPLNLVDPNGWVLPFENLGFVSAREAIWAQVARRSVSAGAAHSDVSNLVLEVLNSLGSGIVSGRGTLGAFAAKEAIILFSDLPWQGGVRYGQSGFDTVPLLANIQSLRNLSETNKIATHLRLVFFPHEGVCTSSACDSFKTAVRQFEGLVEPLSSSTDPQYFKVQVLLSDSAAELQTVTASAISVSDKNAMLSR